MRAFDRLFRRFDEFFETLHGDLEAAIDEVEQEFKSAAGDGETTTSTKTETRSDGFTTRTLTVTTTRITRRGKL